LNDYRNDLSDYRMEKAKTKLESAKLLFEKGQFEDSLSRSYYAMFSAARALLATQKLDSSKHSGVISLFNQHFVKTEIVDKKLGRILMDAKDFREASDYGDYITIDKQDAEEQLKNAELFIENVERVLKVNRTDVPDRN